MSQTEQTPLIGIDRRNDHDAHRSDEKKGFVDCHQVMVHCRTEEQTKAVADLLAEEFGLEDVR